MEVTAVRVDGDELLAERPILGDSSISTSRYRERGIIIGRLNAFEPRERAAARRPSRTSRSSSRSSRCARGWSTAASSAAPT